MPQKKAGGEGRGYTMMIDRIGSIDPIQGNKKTEKPSQVHKNVSSDSVSLSHEAIEKAELYQALEIVSSVPDSRAEKIAELKKKINDPDYLTQQVIEKTADAIMESLGIK